MSVLRRFLFYSQYAFYRPLYSVFESVCSEYGLQGFVITHEQTAMPKVYAPTGYLTPESAGLGSQENFVTVIPRDLTAEKKRDALRKAVREIEPDYIWAYEEPNNEFVNSLLRWSYYKRSPRIVVAVVENLWPSPGGNRERWAKFRRRRLWRRYSGVLACATKSAEAIRSYGMPDSVPISIAWLPHLSGSETAKKDITLPKKSENEFFIGFAGSLTMGKGWRVLLAALTALPENFKCLVAGGGEEESEFRLWCQLPALQSRVHSLGVIGKDSLWTFYRALDVLVLPSLTLPHRNEQFGSVLAEAMSCGIPVIGSTAGAIPEVIGNCGIVVEENDYKALAEAILSIASDAELRERYIARGLERFEREFTVRAYAEKVAALFGLGTIER